VGRIDHERELLDSRQRPGDDLLPSAPARGAEALLGPKFSMGQSDLNNPVQAEAHPVAIGGEVLV
jgi:hypothetical protein